MITILIFRRYLGTVLLSALLLSACGDGSTPQGLRVVATTSIWADVVTEVVGEQATVETLIPRGVDAHDFQPSPRQIAMLREADLVIANGLGLEETLADALAEAVSDGANVLELASHLEPLPFEHPGEHDEEEDEEHDEGLDPHVWFDPLRVAAAAELIAERLATVDPSVDWSARAADYAARLVAADEEIIATLSVVPAERRKLVSNHESLGYFAERYQFEIVGVVIPGGSTLADPSSAELAGLVTVIEAEGVPAIFAETTQPTRLAEAVAAEAGEVEVIQLHTESLGPEGSGAGTLIEMLLTNARLIAEGLAGDR